MWNQEGKYLQAKIENQNNLTYPIILIYTIITFTSAQNG
jgi:hypothetical protein